VITRNRRIVLRPDRDGSTVEGLQQKAGVAKSKLRRLVVKELADNGLDEGGKVRAEGGPIRPLEFQILGGRYRTCCRTRWDRQSHGSLFNLAQRPRCHRAGIVRASIEPQDVATTFNRRRSGVT
jgi:hypothetical protein